jgi:hypothetical protein
MLESPRAASYVGKPAPQWPRGLREGDAARYVGVSPSQFRSWVAEGVMPGPKKQGGVVVWDRNKLDDSFEALPERDQSANDDIWDRVA